MLDNELYPQSHAPGRRSDMYYIDNSTLYSFETTMHHTENTVINHEFKPCCDHLINYAKSHNSCELVLICPLNGSVKEKVRDYFIRMGETQFKNYKKTFSFKIYDFLELSQLKLQLLQKNYSYQKE